MNKELLVTSSPRFMTRNSTSKIMWTVSACLAPAGHRGVYLACMLSGHCSFNSRCCCSELVLGAIFKRFTIRMERIPDRSSGGVQYAPYCPSVCLSLLRFCNSSLSSGLLEAWNQLDEPALEECLYFSHGQSQLTLWAMPRLWLTV